jgi:manganese oxidase
MPPVTRRQLLTAGLITTGSTLAALAGLGQLTQPSRPKRDLFPPPEDQPSDLDNPFNTHQILREFDFGTIRVEQGRTVRVFEITAKSVPIQLNSAISFMSWIYNDRLPGPTLRANEGDRVRILFHNADAHGHTIHLHGVHPAEMDGVKPVRHGETFVYEFDVNQYGLYPYHCHISPVTRHLSKGLYGLLIVDPPGGRPPADELVLVMAGYDLDDDQHNNIYAFNGIPNAFRDRPIRIYQNQRIRIYLVSMIEFDSAVTFHLHANLFDVFPTGRSLQPTLNTDVITMGTAERHILEFSYPYLGKYMFHPHQDHIADLGCMGMFEVVARS